MTLLDDLRALCNAATPDPWERIGMTRLIESMSRHEGVCTMCPNDDGDFHNAAFIAAARTAMPLLIELVEAYKRLLAAKANAELSNIFGRAAFTPGYVDAVAEYNEATDAVEQSWKTLEEICR